MKLPRIFPLALLAYIFAVWGAVELINSAWGNLLPGWHQEAWDNGSGYGKMRGEQGEFQNILLLFGIWVYPFAIAAIYLFTRQAIAVKGSLNRVFCLLAVVACVVVLGRFFWMGVWSAALG